jgi:FkbM family methyltransferase
MILRHILGSDRQTGFYVDVGAYHPVRSSNTYFFYLYGWRGINIEPRPGSKKLFDKIRPKDINLEVGISAEQGKKIYYFIAEDSSMNSLSPDFLERVGMRNEVRQEIPVAVLPLKEVLARHMSEKQHIDFMNVDVEGHDLEVLKSNDWERFRPTVVVVEDNEADPQRSNIVRLMKDNDYQVCAQNVIILGKLNEYFFIDTRL